MSKIKWKVDRIFILSCSQRIMTNWEDEEKEGKSYGVIKASFVNPQRQPQKGKKLKSPSFMCFDESLIKTLLDALAEHEDTLQLFPIVGLEGFVSFGYGNTYLVIEEISGVIL